jgi:hypothetical protein
MGGRSAVDIDTLVDTLVKVQRLAWELDDDNGRTRLNTFLVREQGGLALDALLVRRAVATAGSL